MADARCTEAGMALSLF